MGTYKRQLVVERSLADDISRICREPAADVKKDGVEFDREVQFKNGVRMAIQVCGPGTPGSEPCWAQGVLFSSRGAELGCTEAGDSLLGEYRVTHDGNEYIVEVVKESRKFYRTIVTVEVLSEDDPLTEDTVKDLYSLHCAITEGDCSGKVELVSSERVDGPRMAELLRSQGSDPEFFQLTEDGQDLEEDGWQE